MLSYLGAAILVVGFLVLIHLFRLIHYSKQVLVLAKESSRVMLDSHRSDLEKEQYLKTTTFKLLKLFLIIVIGSLAALLLPAVLLWQLDNWQLVPYQASMDLTLSTEFIIGISVVSILGYVIWRRLQKPADSDRDPDSAGFENRYSGVDQRLHEVAFATLSLQVSLNDFECRRFKKRLAPIQSDHPVFVTALPRAGTTLLLELLVNSGEFVSHTYRDMPFLMVPLLWQKFSARFKHDTEARERAHGDGMMVTTDSPEAFEEIIWRHFWPKHYQESRIVPWQKSQSATFEQYLATHFKKIIAARTGDQYHGQRYVSKNNLNIARLPYLVRLFPESTILVPFRHPLQHARSLLRQHRNFLAIHADDDFACAYMRDIGHYDFGANLKPVDFNHWLASATWKDATTINFWLEYWLNAYRYVSGLDAPQIHLLGYDELCVNPEENLRKIGQAIHLQDEQALLASASRLSAPKAYEVSDDVDKTLLAEAEALFAALNQQRI